MTQPYPIAGPLTTADGQERLVGVELEFAGLDPRTVADLVARVFPGATEQTDQLLFCVHADIGDIEVELDSRWVRRAMQELEATSDGDETLAGLGGQLQDALQGLAQNVIPCEVVMPPLPMSQLARIDPLVDALRAAGARGTRDSVAYAFGLQFNPQVPSLDAATILNYLQAFLCLYEWLAREEAIPLTRRVLPFIDAFPKDYVRRVLADDYAPTMTRLIDDYLADNASRNRVLDLLPLFAMLDEPRVRAAVGDQKVNARPTFHYRLPNSDIDHADWSPRQAWARWLEVEELANEPVRLRAIRREWLEHHGTFAVNMTAWPEKTAAWLARDR